MVTDRKQDWDPESYASFRGLRLRPALDLLAQIHEVPEGDIIDLGCGAGAVGPALRARFPSRALIGVDASPAMLAKAKGYDHLAVADVATWTPERPPAVIFSNACLHWLGQHEVLLPRLVGCLAAGGTLAVQMPRQYGAPSHALLRTDGLPFDPPVAPPQIYARMLAPLGSVAVWETDYVQTLPPSTYGHPVRHFTQSTAMRPYVEGMTETQKADFIAKYDAKLESAYPSEADGTVLFPFKRVFVVVRRA